VTKRNKRPDVDEADVRRRITEGESRASIARSYGMSASSLSHYCRVRNIAPAVGNLPHSERQAMPDDLDVRKLIASPGLLFGADGIVYSTETDPPLARSPRMTAMGMVRMIWRGRQINVTRLMCEAWHGPPPPGTIARRLNGDPTDLRPQNLEWAEPIGKHVSSPDFVRAWQSSESVTEVADRLGLSRAQCHARSLSLRENGVPLRELVVERHDYDELATLARELSPDA
jgi:hypothetical protein